MTRVRRKAGRLQPDDAVKKTSKNGAVKPTEDKLDLSDPVRFLASFKNVDFKHWAADDLLCFRLTATGERYLLLFEGGI